MSLTAHPTLFGQPRAHRAESGEVAVEVATRDEVEPLIVAGHYSHAAAWASSLHMLVFADGGLIGAMQFGPAMNPASGARIVAGSTTDSWLELNRLWMDDDKPANAGSRAIACALRLVRHQRPSVEWVQSFADERCGKFGGIYQACSFLYLGEHTSAFYEIDGQTVHKSMLDRPAVDKRGWRSGPRVAWAKENRDRAERVEYRQFRYVKFLRPRARTRLLLPVMPYPKPSL